MQRYSTPSPKAALKTGNLGKLRVSFYVATMDENLHVTFPEHSGYRAGKKSAVAAVSYSPKVRAAIRKQMLRDFRLLSLVPSNSVDRAVTEKLNGALRRLSDASN